MSLFNSGIRPAVDQWLLNKAAEKRDYGDYWSASSAGYCMRRVVFERLGVPKVESASDARKQRVFTSGHLFHNWLQSITKEAGLSIAQELELQDEELMIRGHIDDLVLVPMFELPQVYKDGGQADPPKQLILYDYKTQNSRAFSYKRPQMSHYHRMQLGTYMYMLNKNHQERVDALYNMRIEATKAGMTSLEIDPVWKSPITEARILKMDKDTLRMTEEQLLWSPELEKDVYEYWSTLNGYWKSKKLPKCTCADYEGGFLAKPDWNGYFKYGEPCSLKYYQEWKEKQVDI